MYPLWTSSTAFDQPRDSQMSGTLTNQITPKYLEPRLLIVTDPRTDQQAIKEAACDSNVVEIKKEAFEDKYCMWIVQELNFNLGYTYCAYNIKADDCV